MKPNTTSGNGELTARPTFSPVPRGPGCVRQVCTAIASQHGVPCASADYLYSQDLGGCCNASSPGGGGGGGGGCAETYSKQAGQAAAAVAAVSAAVKVPTGRIFLGGHSAGGHLSLLLAMRWGLYAGGIAEPPAGYFGIEVGAAAAAAAASC